MLLPVYGIFICLWLTPCSLIPLMSRWLIIACTFLITCIVPAVAVLVLFRMKLISDRGLNRREDRLIPYIVTLLCYVAETVYLMRIGAPRWMWMFMVGAACVVIVSALVNLRWKISGHMAGIGGLTALVLRLMVSDLAVYDLMPLLVVAILLCGALGTSRILLNCHTLGQVLAGWINGFLWVFLLT